MKKLIRNGIEGIFSDADWKSGQPQRFGWQEQGHEKKEIPKEIIQFIERRRPPEPELAADAEVDKPPEPTEIKAEEKPVKKVIKPKAKKNDNPKQKDRPTAKGKPGRVAKN